MQKTLRRANHVSAFTGNPPRHTRKRKNLPRPGAWDRDHRAIQRLIQAERIYRARAQRHIEHNSRHGQSAKQRQRPRAQQQHLAAFACRDGQHFAAFIERHMLRIDACAGQHHRRAADRIQQKHTVRFRAKNHQPLAIRRNQHVPHIRPACKKPGRHKLLRVQPPNHIAPVTCAKHMFPACAQRARAFQPNML